MGSVEEVCEEETDELEGHGDHGIPHETEDGSDGKAVNVDFVAKDARGEDSGFPVRWGCVCGGLFVRLKDVSITTIHSNAANCVGACIPEAFLRDLHPS
jgi:hypothetical protein